MGNTSGRNHIDESYETSEHYDDRERFHAHGDDRLYRGGSSDRGDYYRSDANFTDRRFGDRGSYGGGPGMGGGRYQSGKLGYWGDDAGGGNYGERRSYGGGDYSSSPARGPHRGKGPAGYQRSDERLTELVSEALSEDEFVDATHITVSVRSGEVTLAGSVADRRMKRLAEDCVDRVTGIKDVHNLLRIGAEPAVMGATSAKA